MGFEYRNKLGTSNRPRKRSGVSIMATAQKAPHPPQPRSGLVRLEVTDARLQSLIRLHKGMFATTRHGPGETGEYSPFDIVSQNYSVGMHVAVANMAWNSPLAMAST